MAVKEQIEVTERYNKEFCDNGKRYFETHFTNNGKVVRKCRESWSCDCKEVYYQKYD